ncbi:keratin-associated protein 17-1 [Drosophila suzukii]|uniref:Keratin-associated protein 17-1 n=1 Tax=Drosophila suzukii TaxID=28584 RepID=A0AB39ZXZ2_DROSZ
MSCAAPRCRTPCGPCVSGCKPYGGGGCCGSGCRSGCGGGCGSGCGSGCGGGCGGGCCSGSCGGSCGASCGGCCGPPPCAVVSYRLTCGPVGPLLPCMKCTCNCGCNGSCAPPFYYVPNKCQNCWEWGCFGPLY